MWGDTSPISGRVLANLPVALNSGQANNKPGTAFTLVDANVSTAQVVVHNEFFVDVVHWKIKHSTLEASKCRLSIIASTLPYSVSEHTSSLTSSGGTTTAAAVAGGSEL